jgi:excisionase family DNA binding protein
LSATKVIRFLQTSQYAVDGNDEKDTDFMRNRAKTGMSGAMLTVDQAWDRLGGKEVITRQALYLAAARGELPSVRLGRRVLIPRTAFESWMTGKPQETDA